MVYQRDPLDAAFGALADGTRRAILAQLASGERSISEIARSFSITLPAVSKHVRVLERAGLATVRQEGRTRHCRLVAMPLRDAAGWIDRYRSFWETSFDRLASYLDDTLTEEDPHMPNATSATAPATVLEVRRYFPATRERVFAAWTSAEALKRWHAPDNAVVQDAGVDFRVDGRWHVRMLGNDGQVHHVRGVYREIDAPRRIVLTWRWESNTDGQDSTVTVEFFERDGGTEIVLTHGGLVSEQERQGHRHGWVGCFDKLAMAV